MANLNSPQVISHLLAIDEHLDQFHWESFKEGIEISRIYDDAINGPAAALLRYAAGAEVPLHRHGGYEHILILSGSQTDGVEVYGKGTLMISAPGSQHRIVSESGCIVLAIWHKPVAFLAAVQD